MLEEMGVNVRGQSSFMSEISKMQHFGANQSNPLNDSQISCRSSRAAGSELQPNLCVLYGGFMCTHGHSVGLYWLILLGSAVTRLFLSILKRTQQLSHAFILVLIQGMYLLYVLCSNPDLSKTEMKENPVRRPNTTNGE